MGPCVAPMGLIAAAPSAKPRAEVAGLLLERGWEAEARAFSQRFQPLRRASKSRGATKAKARPTFRCSSKLSSARAKRSVLAV